MQQEPLQKLDQQDTISRWPQLASYKPLANGSIRLLTVYYGSYNNNIQCHLDHYPLDRLPTYDALSYCWGVNPELKPISVNGESILIGENLWNFLWHLRKDYGTMLLWLDVICINQHDVQERNHQVSQMGPIYSNASRVFAWLGDSSPAIQRALNVSYQDANMALADRKHKVLGPAYIEMLRRPYWTRMWVIQELILARTIVLVCGPSKLDFNHKETWKNAQKEAWELWFQIYPLITAARADKSLQHALHIVESIHAYRGYSSRWASRSFLNEVPSKNFAQAVRDFSNNDCTDKRDKIFALRAFVFGGTSLNVDYSKSCEEIFFEIIRLGLMDVIEDFYTIRYLAEQLSIQSPCSSPELKMRLNLRLISQIQEFKTLEEPLSPTVSQTSLGRISGMNPGRTQRIARLSGILTGRLETMATPLTRVEKTDGSGKSLWTYGLEKLKLSHREGTLQSGDYMAQRMDHDSGLSANLDRDSIGSSSLGHTEFNEIDYNSRNKVPRNSEGMPKVIVRRCGDDSSYKLVCVALPCSPNEGRYYREKYFPRERATMKAITEVVYVDVDLQALINMFRDTIETENN